MEARYGHRCFRLRANKGEEDREREDVQVELKDCRQVHKLSGDEKTTEEQLNNATSLHSGILCGVLYYIPGVLE